MPLDTSSTHQTVAGSAFRAAAGGSAALDDASGRPLLARIPRRSRQAGGFLDLCFTPELAAEVTLQPIRRFNFDAAIIFSDILVIPYALGRNVRFEVGEGPRLDPLDTPDKVRTLSSTGDFTKLELVFEALRRVRRELDPRITLIGFCGALGRSLPTWSRGAAHRIRRRRA